MGAVTRAKVIECHCARAAYALGDVLARHLYVDPTCMAAFLLMHVEECLHLSLQIQYDDEDDDNDDDDDDDDDDNGELVIMSLP